MMFGSASFEDGGDLYTTQGGPGSTLTTAGRGNWLGGTGGGGRSSSRLSATCAAMSRCRSIIKLHLEHVQSFHSHLRLCPFKSLCTPWFRHLAQRGERIHFSWSHRGFSLPDMSLARYSSLSLRQLWLKLLVLQFALFQLITVKQLIYHLRYFDCKWVLLFELWLIRYVIGGCRISAIFLQHWLGPFY